VHLAQNVYGVAIGGSLGHAICTGIAVVGGRLLAQRISVRTGMCSLCIARKGNCLDRVDDQF
jgi:putative Ca2+/H+ antiporter (TMEM165/GDT1 family)